MFRKKPKTVTIGTLRELCNLSDIVETVKPKKVRRKVPIDKGLPPEPTSASRAETSEPKPVPVKTKAPKQKTKTVTVTPRKPKSRKNQLKEIVKELQKGKVIGINKHYEDGPEKRVRWIS